MQALATSSATGRFRHRAREPGRRGGCGSERFWETSIWLRMVGDLLVEHELSDLRRMKGSASDEMIPRARFRRHAEDELPRPRSPLRGWWNVCGMVDPVVRAADGRCASRYRSASPDLRCSRLMLPEISGPHACSGCGTIRWWSLRLRTNSSRTAFEFEAVDY